MSDDDRTTTLTLRLAGPLQSWGVASRHTTRSTITYPTKSGVIGLLAAAQGRPRGADLSDLAALRFGVREDQPGRLLIDYHTVSAASHAPDDPSRQRLPTADGKTLKADSSTKVTHRHYLADAVFVAAVCGPPPLLDELSAALDRPRYPLYLGRRSCPPAGPVRLHLWPPGTSIERALGETPWQASRSAKRRIPASLRVVIEDPAGDDVIADQPLPSPAFDRRFAGRPVRHDTVAVRAPTSAAAGPRTGSGHDPYSLLE